MLATHIGCVKGGENFFKNSIFNSYTVILIDNINTLRILLNYNVNFAFIIGTS